MRPVTQRRTALLGSLALTFAATGCVGDEFDTASVPAPSSPAPSSPDPSSPDPSSPSSDIRQSATWTGTTSLAANTRILPGVEITMAPGATLVAEMGVFLSVEGSFIAEGTAQNPVTLTSANAGWGGIKAAPGGRVRLAFVNGTKTAIALKCEAGAALCAIEDSRLTGIGKAIEAYDAVTIDRSHIEDMANAGLSLYTGGSLTVRDSYLLHSTHDLIVQSGGDLVFEHSHIGGAMGTYEHCNFHIGNSASVRVTNSVVGSSIYGLMIAGAGDSIWTGNNFVENDPGKDVLDLGGATNVNMQGNYWDQGAPTPGPGIDTSNPLMSPNPTAGPRM